MAKYVFKNVKDLENDLKTGIKAALKEPVGMAIAKMMMDNAKEIVYEGYSPRVYDHAIGDRRHSLDEEPNNYDIQVDGDMNLSVTPVAEFNPYIYIYNKKTGKWNKSLSSNRGNELAGLINYGDGWNGHYYDFSEERNTYDEDSDDYEIEDEEDYESYSRPRPFIDITREELKEGMAKELLAESLKMMGYTVV